MSFLLIQGQLITGDWIKADLRIDLLDVIRDIYEGNYMNGELAKDRANYVEIENIWLRTLFRELFDRLLRIRV